MQFDKPVSLDAARDIQRHRVMVLAGAVLLVASALSNGPARATPCGAQGDMLAHADALATVQPADCATVLRDVPVFSWPAQQEAERYTVALTFPDGHVETRATSTNGIAWDGSLPAGPYTWTVRSQGTTVASSQPRRFTLDGAAVQAPRSMLAGRRARGSAG